MGPSGHLLGPSELLCLSALLTLSRSPMPNDDCAIPSLAVNDADRRCSDGNK